MKKLTYIQKNQLYKLRKKICIAIEALVFAIIIVSIWPNPETTKAASVLPDDIRDTIGSVELLDHSYMKEYALGLDEKWSEKAAIDLVLACNAWYPEVILAQMQIESSNFKSDLAKASNNGFGMKKVKGRRPTLQLEGSCGTYGKYKNWQSSIVDRIWWEWWVFKYKMPSKNVYINKIASIYAEDPAYRSKLDKISKHWEEKISLR